MTKKLPSPEKYNRKYHFFFSKKENGDTKTLSFTMDIKKEVGSPLVELIRSHFEINNQKPDGTPIGGLIYRSSEVLYPLKLNLTETGYINKIINYEEILSYWKNIKQKLTPECDNNYSLELVERIGKLYENPEKLLSGLKNDWFYSVFFLPIYQNYKDNLYTVKYKFPFSSYRLKLELLEKENTTLEILVKGVLENEEKSKVNGFYILNPDRSIHTLYLQISSPLTKEELQIEIQEVKKQERDYKAVGILYDADKERKEKEKKRNSPVFFIGERKIK